MKYLLSFLLLANLAMAETSTLEVLANQEELVVQDLEQIQNHGKKWHAKLKKATTAIKPLAGRQAQNEG